MNLIYCEIFFFESQKKKKRKEGRNIAQKKIDK